jgi:hypothetical protein
MAEKTPEKRREPSGKRLSVYGWGSRGYKAPQECYKTPLRAASRKGVSLHEKASRGERGLLQSPYAGAVAASHGGWLSWGHPAICYYINHTFWNCQEFFEIFFIKNGHRPKFWPMPPELLKIFNEIFPVKISGNTANRDVTVRRPRFRRRPAPRWGC